MAVFGLLSSTGRPRNRNLIVFSSTFVKMFLQEHFHVQCCTYNKADSGLAFDRAGGRRFPL